MKHPFTARIMLGNDEIMHQAGDDVEELYVWMLTQAEGQFGNVHGEIVDNKSKEVVRQFRKAPPE